MKITEDAAHALTTRLLEQRKVPQTHAAVQSRVLVDAELSGHPSHGLQRLPRLLARIERGLADPQSQGTGRWRANAVLEVDGQRGLGPVVAMAALERLSERVPSTGIALAAIRNGNHLGMLSWYVRQAADRGFVAIAMSSSEALVHPHGGTRALLGTNPIALAVPTAGRPLVVDLATSTVSMGKIHHHAAIGQAIPEGWARDADGKPTTDAARAKLGALAPFGGAKGYGLGIGLELLIACVANSALAPAVRGTLDAEDLCNKGDLLMLIQPGAHAGMAQQLDAYLDAVRHSTAADPAEPVRIPGDRAAQRREISRRDGFDLAPALWSELQSLSTSPANSFTQRGATQ